ncbi:protein ENHANCED PSEUDOMONAS SUSCEPTIBILITY 1-like [Triticum urartu]|uniref:protein ENHANCED PSEUDOMONAS SUSCEPTIBILITY 1-like n=1 Tax=Triticum urartu TaxID=4572 RepID=UPI002042DEF5|nr:protein ENHANCED PSEUDOMONAS SUSCEPTIBILITY 1-like [Triticum urartu]
MAQMLSAMTMTMDTVPTAPAIMPAQPICLDAPLSGSGIAVLSRQAVHPDGPPSALGDLTLSVSDLPMLSCHYIQKGLFFPAPDVPMASLVSLLVSSLSRALAVFPALAGRFVTLPDDRIVIRCNDAGVEFRHAVAPALSLNDFLVPNADVPTRLTKDLFPMDRTVSYEGHRRPLTSFQLTVLGDGAVFIGIVANHAVVDGTSFWHFYNTWAALCRGASPRLPDFRRNFFGESTAVLRFAGGVGPAVTFDADAPLRERIFHFSRDAIRELKAIANRRSSAGQDAEVYGKMAHDPKNQEARGEISSFQSLCAQIWISTTRARKQLDADATTTLRLAVNCRHRLRPAVSPAYFGNAIQSAPTTATVAELASNDLRWAASRLNASLAAYGDEAIRGAAAGWQAAPRCFPLGNPDGAVVTMGSSNRFPMYEGNDFGWGRPLAVRSGRANKFDGKMSAFPGRSGDGSVDIEVCLAPDTMAALLRDDEFMQYVSCPAHLL